MKKKELKQRIVDLEHENIRLKKEIGNRYVELTRKDLLELIDNLHSRIECYKEIIERYKNLSKWGFFKLIFKRK
jgi:hypothetical protein